MTPHTTPSEHDVGSSVHHTMEPYTPDHPLQPGITVLEASAGTGKTYTLTFLYVRLLLERCLEADQIVVVTFTNAAAAELRERIHERISETERVLLARERGDRLSEDDLGDLATIDDILSRSTVDNPLEVLQRARTVLDKAVISTIHSFAQKLGDEFSSMTGTPSGTTEIEDLKHMIEPVLIDIEQQLAEQYPDAADLLSRNTAVHKNAQKLTQAFLNDTSVMPLPEATFYFPKLATLLDGVQRFPDLSDDHTVMDLAAEEFRRFVTWMHQEGESICRAWFDEQMALKNYADAKLKDDLIQKNMETLYALEDQCHQDHAAQSLWNAFIQNDIFKNKGHRLRCFDYDYLCEHHQVAKTLRKKNEAIPDDLIPAWSRSIQKVRQCFELNEAIQIFEAAWTQRLALSAAKEVRRRAQRAGKQSFSSIIHTIANAIQDPENTQLLSSLQRRYKAALIDEFQDTDMEQWTLFEHMFPRNRSMMVLIGDPKQAIYAFRGANVAVYTMVKTTHADRVMSLDTNYRSDALYNQAVNAFFGPESPAPFPSVQSPDRTPARRVQLAPTVWPESVADQRNVVTGGGHNDALIVRYSSGHKVDSHRRFVARNITQEIAFLLNHPDQNQLWDDALGEFRPVRSHDCGVLVRTAKEGANVVAALSSAGIPAVMKEKESVAHSEAARGVLHWLHAIAHPNDPMAIRAFLFSPLVGHSLDELNTIEDDELTAWSMLFAQLRDGWMFQGLHASLRTTLLTPLHPTIAEIQELFSRNDNGHSPQEQTDVMSRLLRRASGLRIAGDLMHLAGVLHTEQQRSRHTPAGLYNWFVRLREKEAEIPSDALKLRIASDEDAVTVMTAHSAKGLEFPLVWLTGLTSSTVAPDFLVATANATNRYALQKHQFGALTLKDSATKPQQKEYEENCARFDGQSEDDFVALNTYLERFYPSTQSEQLTAERPATFKPPFSIADVREATEQNEQREQLRLLYVALTRGRMRTVLYVHADCDKEPTVAIPLKKTDRLSAGERWPATPEALGGLARSAPWAEGTLTVEQWLNPNNLADIGVYFDKKTEVLRDDLRILTPPVVRATRQQRPSFSSLVHLLPDHYEAGPHGSQDEEPARTIETNLLRSWIDKGLTGDGEDDLEITDVDYLAVDDHALPDSDEVLPLSDYAAGREAGTALHRVFELLDFEGAALEVPTIPWQSKLETIVQEALIHNGVDPAQTRLLADGLWQVLRTPLGGVLGARRLADIGRRDRLDELKFLMPIGQDQHRAAARDIFQALQSRRGDGIIPDAWFEDLERAQQLDFQGLMLGFIDLTFRTTIDGHTRYFVVDYKSNRLASTSEPITSSTFTQQAIRDEMRRHHYFLQYHIYLVALHRWLRTRVPDYAYDTHIGGAYYLFVRGMSGPGTPRNGEYPNGVFFDRPTYEVIDALDRALSSYEQAMAPEVHA